MLWISKFHIFVGLINPYLGCRKLEYFQFPYDWLMYRYIISNLLLGYIKTEAFFSLEQGFSTFLSQYIFSPFLRMPFPRFSRWQAR